MSNITAPADVEPDRAYDDNIVHLVCECNHDVALCGTAVPGSCWISDGNSADCVVCVDLCQIPCERCGD